MTERGRLRVLLCEPYFTGSHRAWAEGLATHSRHDVRLITHAGGFWKWRMQGAALTMATQVADAASGSDGPPDALLVSDMVHVPALLGFARDELAGVPVLVYFHENQLSYPVPEGATADDTYAMTNWLSMVAAARVVFNSDYHRREVLTRLPTFLGRFPDHRHTRLVSDVERRSAVLPVGIDAARFAGETEGEGKKEGGTDPPVVLWNHRWEYDKDPRAFFAALDAVLARGAEFRLIVAGESFQTVPEEFAASRARLGSRVIHFGTASDDAYPALLRRADIVVSTARHEFFGVAVVEAMAAGAMPILPHRLSYPELVPAPDPYLYRDDEELVDRLYWALTCHDDRRQAAALASAHALRFDWHLVAPRYDDLLEATAAERHRHRWLT